MISIALSKGVCDQSSLFIKFSGFQLHWKHFAPFLICLKLVNKSWREVLADLCVECVTVSFPGPHQETHGRENCGCPKIFLPRVAQMLKNFLLSLAFSRSLPSISCVILCKEALWKTVIFLWFKAENPGRIQPCWPGTFRAPYCHLVAFMEHKITGKSVKIYCKMSTDFKRPMPVFLLPFNSPGKTKMQLAFRK